jgi:two-component system LytT family response regulator
LIGERAHRLCILKVNDIEYLEADGNYVKLHASNAEYISRDSVKRLSRLLAARGFLRIERSLLINVRAVSYVERSGRGTYSFAMLSGAWLQSGPKYGALILCVLPLGQRSSPSSSPVVE